MKQAFRGIKVRASSLVTTLLVLVVLSTIVVAFMQSMSVERLSSKSVKNTYEAQLAAKAGVDSAVNRLRTIMLANPFHAIGYRNVNGQNIPVLFGASGYRQSPTYNYLISTVDAATAPPATNATNSIPINSRNTAADPYGWMGSPLVNGVASYIQNRAPWVNILANPNLPAQPNPNAPNYNPIVARYSYWIEDETSKVDFSVAGNMEGSGGGFKRFSPGLRPIKSDTNFARVWDLDIGAIPLKDKKPLDWDPAGGDYAGGAVVNTNIINFYRGNTNSAEVAKQLIDPKLLNQAASPVENIYDPAKFYATAASHSSELAGTGKRRVNLNYLVRNTTTVEDIKNDLDDIIFTITGKHSWPGAGRMFGGVSDLTGAEQPMPDFGKRFFRNPTPTTAQEAIYLRKLAANIRDYIDNEDEEANPSQPTFINNDGDVVSGSAPNLSWTTGDEPQAIGKEAIPYLQEFAYYAVERSYTLAGTTATIGFTIDNYLEFYNPYTKDFVAPAGTFIKIYSRMPFDTGGFPAFVPPDLNIPIGGTRFRAGAATVLTTAPDGEDPPGFIKGPDVVRLPVSSAQRAFTLQANSSFTFEGQTRRGMRFLGRNSAYLTDYQTEVVWGNANGYYDAFPFNGFGLSTTASAASPPPRLYFGGLFVGQLAMYVYPTSMRGNDSDSRSGDPRSLSEQLRQTAGSASAEGNDQSRFFSNTFAVSTMGHPAISYVNPVSWPDPHVALDGSVNTAYATIRDGPMLSIGELGNIYDPFRKLDTNPGAVAANIAKARGGGRTLKIGQKDDLVTGTSRFTAVSGLDIGWYHGAWRLCDLFSAEDKDTEISPVTARGKVNINGILRDDGVAFRAVLRQLKFDALPDTGPAAVANRMLTQAQIDQIVSQVKTYLQTYGPMMDRGELGRIDFFSNVNNATGGPNLSTAYDRTREEVFRKVVELITTRSASFTVYAIGEAVRQKPDGSIVRLGQKRLKRTFMLEAQFPAETANAKVSDFKERVLYESE